MRDIKYREITETRRFGVELEVSNNLLKEEIGTIMSDFEKIYSLDTQRKVILTDSNNQWSQSRGNDYWHVKFDRTCGPSESESGWEVASYIACGHKDIGHIGRAARFLGNCGAQTNLNCGLHVHVEVADFDNHKIGIMLARWMKIEQYIYSICNVSRSMNPFCTPLRTRCICNFASYYPENPAGFWLGMKPTNLNTHSNPERRVAINTVEYAIAQKEHGYNRNTIELRVPECLLDELHVSNWIRLILHFVDVCSQSVEPSDIFIVNSLEETLYYLGLQDNKDFIICGPELLDLKLWFLNKLTTSRDVKIQKPAKIHLEFISSI